LPVCRSFYFWSVVAFYLSGCTILSTSPEVPTTPISVHQKHLATIANIQQFSLKGRLGVVTNPNGFSGSIDWQHKPTNDNIQVFSPLGSKVASIAKTPHEVKLTTQDGRVIKAQDAEALTEATLGWRLPLIGLSDWAIGRPSKSKIEASTWDENGRLITLKQDGWDIRYENYSETNGYSIPNKIVLKSEKVNLKLLVETWSGL